MLAADAGSVSVPLPPRSTDALRQVPHQSPRAGGLVRRP